MSNEITILETKKKYYTTMLKMNQTIKKLISFVEKILELNLVSKEYQKAWLDLIDKELVNGETEASFWKKKSIKF